MAYSDYGQMGGGRFLPKPQVQPRMGSHTFNPGDPSDPSNPYSNNTGVTGGRISPGGLQPGGQPQAPAGDPAPLPTNTRAGALQQVQQAYAGRMPGQMDALNNALSSFAAPVGLDDPGIQPALRAGAMGDQRNFERQRAALAEALGANGLGDSGAFNTQMLGAAQRIGEAGASRDAGLVYDEMGGRRNALLSALGMDQQRYSVDSDLGLRLLLAELQANQAAVQPFF